MFKKFLLTISIFAFLFSTKAFAAVDVSLIDDTDEGTISVIVDSNEEYLDGVDMRIYFSDDITIENTDVLQTDEFCSFGNNFDASNGVIYIECLNDSGTVVDGTLVTIPYTASSQDYYFYVDSENIDLGLKTLGEVVDVNKLVEDTETTTISDDDTEEITFVQKGIDFLSENYFYVIGGALLLIALIVVITMISSKDEKVVTTESSTDTPVQPTQES